MEENKIIAFLSQHWSKVLLGILALATVAVWSERFFSSSKNENKHDFFIAGQIFERFHKGEYLASESIEATQNILNRHPELHPKYDLVLALTYFSQQKVAEGLPYARSLIEHAESQLSPFYKDYALTTLLISEEKYSEAFAAANSLQEKLSSQSDYQTLDAMNTLRLFFLADQLGDIAHKKMAWDKLEKHSEFPMIEALFHEGNVTLSDYSRHG